MNSLLSVRAHFRPAQLRHARLLHRAMAVSLLGILSLLHAPAVFAQQSASSVTSLPENTYAIQHTLLVQHIPSGAKTVRIWFWLPQNDAVQKVSHFKVVQSPPGYRIVNDASAGMTYLYCDVTKPTQPTIKIVTDFTVYRRRVKIHLNPRNVQPLNSQQRVSLADDLQTDVPHMVVDSTMRNLADRICGNQTNVATEAHLLYNYVVNNTQQYSKSPTAPKSSQEGDAAYCLLNGGGACTDMHSLFIALARARGIPTRIDFGSLLPEKNEGKTVNPGYRCWVLFFVPGYGWVPSDMAAANLAPETQNFYFGGLDARRVLFSRGRDLTLTPKQNGPPVNLFIGAYVEVNGKPYKDFTRRLLFHSQNPQFKKQ